MITHELTVEATVDNLSLIMEFLEERLEAASCPLKAQMQITVAAEEIYVNIAHYAYAPETGEATIRFEASEDGTSVSITFLDRGVPFDPLAKPDPDVSLAAEDRDIGGLGIYMTKKTMDEVRYSYEDGQNILTLVKNIR